MLYSSIYSFVMNMYNSILCFIKIWSWVTANFQDLQRGNFYLWFIRRSKFKSIFLLNIEENFKVNLSVSVGLHVGWSATFAHQLRGSFRWLCKQQSILTFWWWWTSSARGRVPSWRTHFDVQMTEAQCHVIFGVICAVEQESQRPRNPRRFTEKFKPLTKHSQ